MAEFGLYLEIVHKFHPSLEQVQNLLEICAARAQSKCTHDDFLMLMGEFEQVADSGRVLSYEQFSTCLRQQYPIVQMLQLLQAYILRDLSTSLQQLFIRFLNLLNPIFISADELCIIFLTVLNQDELQSVQDLFDFATQTIIELSGINGVVPYSAFIHFLTGFGVDESSLNVNISEIEQFLSQFKTFRQILEENVSNKRVARYIQADSDIYQMRFGAKNISTLITQICAKCQSALQLTVEQRNEVQAQLQNAFVFYENELQHFLKQPISKKEKSITVKIEPETDGESPGFNIDALIVAAEWEEIDLKQKINLNEEFGNKNTTKLTFINTKVEDDELSYDGGETIVKETNKTQFTLSTKQIQKVVTQKDDDVLKKLKKVLNSMK
ncbi:Conserved_hypothetical protein [Hexamita inflata]|uniref:Uncharacterized protein n=1 Tax=Hexamita inflata TaxID=28002 RepID=A0ABP1GIW6_9EUKA